MAKDYHSTAVFRRWRRPVKFPDREWVSESLRGRELQIEAVVYRDGSVKYFHDDMQLESSEWAYAVSMFFMRDQNLLKGKQPRRPRVYLLPTFYNDLTRTRDREEG